MTRRIVDIIGDNLSDDKYRPLPVVGPAQSAHPSPEAGGDVYRRLREGITSGQFQPNERLVEANLTRMLGSGRTAVRAALVRLDQEGLVTRELNRGARVRLVSDQEALDIEETRSALERLLARQAAVKGSSEEVRQLGRILIEMRRRFAAGDSIGTQPRRGWC